MNFNSSNDSLHLLLRESLHVSSYASLSYATPAMLVKPLGSECVGIAVVIERNSVVLGSHTGSSKTRDVMYRVRT
ncbi:unnamed protein product [Eruca vesicaria subsp. sativa]|uniref:CMP/dCMP-type deaminase domain-containing protein n=1 Tax=Eruca vesicaria subsp. sativa TaxID=29727 RepID=A0ABC8IR23_ERUVS|nr:unnamed protein product [Eruca vesicaria subsp. sativa]